jgi:hypothetical protein
MAEWNRGNEPERDRERERWNRPEGDQGWRDRGREDDRGFVARGTDEVRSWFGDDEAERRRRMDEQRDDWRDRDRGGDRWRATGRDEGRRGPYAWEGGGRYGAEGHWDRGQNYGRGAYDPASRGDAPRWQEQGRWSEARHVPERSGASGVWNTGSDWSQRGTGSEFRDRGVTSYSYTEVWMIPGPFTGRGPRGYQRSDDRISEDVCERLTHHGQIDARDIDVSVQGGEVYLRGSVDTREAKRQAEDIAEAVSGVREVHNELRISRGGADAGLVGRGSGLTGDTRTQMAGTGATRDRDARTATPEDRPSGSDAPEIQARAGLGKTPDSGQDNPDSILGLSPTAGGTTQTGTTPGTTPAGTTASDAARRNRSTTYRTNGRRPHASPARGRRSSSRSGGRRSASSSAAVARPNTRCAATMSASRSGGCWCGGRRSPSAGSQPT